MAYGSINTQDKRLSIETKLILEILKSNLGTKHSLLTDFDEPGKINWVLFKRLLLYHELAPFTYSYFKSSSLAFPNELMSFLKSYYHLAIFQNEFFQNEFLKINSIFTQEGIYILPIKGLALLRDTYVQIPERPMVDMDVLVQEHKLDRAEQLLTKLGYKKYLKAGNEYYWRHKNCDIPFKKEDKKGLLELHFALDLKRYNRYILPHLWNRLRSIESDNNKINLLSPEDTLFSLALHQRRFGKRLSLKNVLDVALLINKYKDNFDWDYVLKEAKSGKMCNTIFFVLFQAKILLDISLPKDILRKLGVPFWKKRLMYKFIKKDTFSPNPFEKLKYIYFKNHFLLYDSLWEPIDHIVHITQEEFAKYHNLPLYAPRTKKLYRIWFLYTPYKLIKDNLRKIKNLSFSREKI